MNFSKVVWLMSILVLTVSGVFAATSIQWDTVIVEENWAWSTFVAWSIVSVINEQIGDIFVLWESVSLDAIINGDVRWAWQSVVVNKQINDDARLAWRTVIVNAPIQWELWVAAETTTINASVLLPTHIISQTVSINAQIAPGSVIEWDTILVSVPLQWPLTINSSSVSFVGDWSIQGAVITSSSSIQSSLTQAWWTVEFNQTPIRENTQNNHRKSFPWFTIFCIVVFSWIIIRYLPNYIARTTTILKDTIAKSFWVWAGILIGTPIISLLLLITVVWAPVAWVLIMLWIFLLIFLKVLIVVIGSQLIWVYYPYFLKTQWHRLLVILLSSIIIAFLPWALVFVLWCFAVWASCQQDWKIIKEIA